MPEEIEIQPEEIIEEQPNRSILEKMKTHKFKIFGGVLGVLVFAGEGACSAFFAAGFCSPSAPNPIPENTITHTNENIPTMIGFQIPSLFRVDIASFLPSR